MVLESSKWTRPQIARKVEEIGWKLIGDKNEGYTGFLPKNSAPNVEDDQHGKRMMCIVSDRDPECNLFVKEVKKKGIPIIPYGGGLSKDYDYAKYQEGHMVKEYTYKFLIPYISQRTNLVEPIMCSLFFQSNWFVEGRGHDEMNSRIYCDSSRDGLKKTLDELASNMKVIVKEGDIFKIQSVY